MAWYVGIAESNVTSAVVDAAAGTQTEIVATPGAGKQIWVYGYDIGFDAAGTMKWQSANTDLSEPIPRAQNGGSAPYSSNIDLPIFKCATNEALNITTVTAAVTGIVTYRVVGV